ncbi:MAG: methylthioribulose 1-phosphate dehydratase, partial [Myxococcales bacterium]|nr:methylthioribulose 1-phosphate dehydratase [Myxococcales bacterium]
LLGFTPAGEALGRMLPRPRDGATLRPSAETALHLQLYRRDPSVGAVLHVHGEAATVLSMVVKGDTLVLTGFELLKALRGVTHHDAQVALPILDNDQDMEALAAQVEARLDAAPGVPGYLLRGHGLYTWGADLAEAERHVEALDFLFRCKLRLRQEGWR